MNVSVIKETTVHTTPTQLRMIADEMEKMFRNCKLGEDVPKITRYGKGCKIVFVADQEEIYNEEWRKEKGNQ